MPCFGNQIKPINENAKIIELLENEKGYGNEEVASYQEGTMVASVYNVKNNNLDTIVSDIKTRINSILTANSWLMCRCRHVPDDNRLVLVTEEKFSDTQDYIYECVTDEIKSLKFNDVKKVLMKQKITYLSMLWDKDSGLLTKFGILTSTDKTKVVVFLCMNHVLGDGSTLYQVWKMLDKSQPIVELQVSRNMSFDTDDFVKTKTSVLPEGIRPEGFANVYMANFMMPCIMKGISQDFKGKPQNQFLVTLNQEEIARRKTVYSNPAANINISTNDIILSWMQDLLPKINHIFIPVNFRNRIPGITNNMAGNYFQLPMLYNKDMQTPLTVRTWLNNVLKPGFDWKFPTKKEFQKYLGGVNTSWTGFYHHVEPEGLSQICHFPVYPNQDECKMGPINMGQELDFIVFKSGKDENGVDEVSCSIFSRRPEITRESLMNDAMVKKELSLE